MKKKILYFLRDLICYAVLLLILLFIAKKQGWTDVSVVDNVIGLTVAWVIFRLVTLIVAKRKNKSEHESDKNEM